jgi:hypothetical protein
MVIKTKSLEEKKSSGKQKKMLTFILDMINRNYVRKKMVLRTGKAREIW